MGNYFILFVDLSLKFALKLSFLYHKIVYSIFVFLKGVYILEERPEKACRYRLNIYFIFFNLINSLSSTRNPPADRANYAFIDTGRLGIWEVARVYSGWVFVAITC